jgi:hypothetical protein
MLTRAYIGYPEGILVVCRLARYSHSRDERPGNLQIVFGLLTNHQGCPVAVEVSEGTRAIPKPWPRRSASCGSASGCSKR